MSKPVKIIHLITALNVGGAEVMLFNLLTHTNRQLFDPIVISLMDCGEIGQRIKDLGIPVHSIGMKRGFPSLANLRKLVALLRKIRPALIQGWMYHGNLAAQIGSVLARRRIPIVWAIHHTLYSLSHETRVTQATVKLSAKLSRRPAHIVYVSQTSRAQHEQLGFFAGRSSVIPNGFDMQQFRASPEAKSALCAELKVPEDTLLIGVIGRFQPMKDHPNFLRAAHLLTSKISSVHFVMIGNELDKSNEVLWKLVQELNLSERVHLLGQRRDMPRLMAALDILSSSSSHGEAFPMVIGEAMACQTPCVVTDVGDSGLLVGETGLVVPPRDPQGLANAWEKWSEAGQAQREALGRAARQRIEENYSLTSVVERYQDLYATLLSSR